MARDSSGNYTLPAGNPVVTGTTIEATWANATLSDIATALTNSLDRTGKGAMTASLKLADGSISGPGLSFNSETNSGIYRAGSGDIRMTVLGSDTAQFFQGSVTLLNDAATAAAGPELELHRNSSSPAASDQIGAILFAGENDAGEKVTYGDIQASIVSVADGAESGQMVFSTMQGGTLSTVLTLNSAGEIIASGDIEGGDPGDFLLNAQVGPSAATYSFVGDTDTGLYRPASNTVGVLTGGAERLRIDSDGKVGIGISSPDQDLHISGGRALVEGTFEPQYLCEFSGVPVATNALLGGVEADSNVRILGAGGDPDTELPQAVGSIQFRNANSWQFPTPPGTADPEAYIQFNVLGNEQMRIDSSGNVGIGLTSPGFSLSLPQSAGEAFGFGTDSTGFTFDGVTIPDYGISYTQPSDFNTVVSAFDNIKFTTGRAERFRINPQGNVLIGGTSAGASAQATLTLFNGVAPTGSVTDGVILYSEDVSTSAELKVRDEAGNVTTLSPHNFDLIPGGPSEDMAWAYYSERGDKRINVDMLRLARLVERVSGEKLVYEE